MKKKVGKLQTKYMHGIHLTLLGFISEIETERQSSASEKFSSCDIEHIMWALEQLPRRSMARKIARGILGKKLRDKNAQDTAKSILEWSRTNRLQRTF